MNTNLRPPITHALSAPDRAATAAMRAAITAPKGSLSGPAARPAYDTLMQRTPAAPGVAFEAATVGGVAGWWCRPAAARPDSAVLFLHGGVFVLGTAEANRNLASQLAARAEVDFFVADYRLAPEHPFPAALNDTLAAYYGLAALGRQRLALCGSSAGGNLALAALARTTQAAAHDPAALAPRGGAVISPWLNLELSFASMQTRAAADPFLLPAALAADAQRYLQGHPAHDPDASPVYGPLAGLPPVQVQVGDDEVLLDDSVQYVARAQAAVVAAELHVWEGMAHVFPGSVPLLEAAGQSLDLMGAFLAEQLR